MSFLFRLPDEWMLCCCCHGFFLLPLRLFFVLLTVICVRYDVLSTVLLNACVVRSGSFKRQNNCNFFCSFSFFDDSSPSTHHSSLVCHFYFVSGANMRPFHLIGMCVLSIKNAQRTCAARPVSINI